MAALWLTRSSGFVPSLLHPDGWAVRCFRPWSSLRLRLWLAERPHPSHTSPVAGRHTQLLYQNTNLHLTLQCSEIGGSSLDQSLVTDLSLISFNCVPGPLGAGIEPVVLSFSPLGSSTGCAGEAVVLSNCWQSTQAGQWMLCCMHALMGPARLGPWEGPETRGHADQIGPSPVGKAALLYPNPAVNRG